MPEKNKNNRFVLWFDEVGIEDIPLVGGKNASLGEMHSKLSSLGVKVPNGFAITAYAYRYFLEQGQIRPKLERALNALDTKDIKALQKAGKAARKAILDGTIPPELRAEIIQNYKKLSEEYKKENVDVAVRSSATAEDLPDASFAGQQETYLNISGEEALMEAVKKCLASLFTDRAISYRTDKSFSHFDTALSVTIQKMVRSDLASSGIMFTLDTETGFNDVVVINSSYGLGELIVQGAVTPDEFLVFKPSLREGLNAVIGKNIGTKEFKAVYALEGISKKETTLLEREAFSLTNDEVIHLSKWGVVIEEYFSKKKNHYQPMDMEWAKDGETNELFIVQARPETIHSSAPKDSWKEYRLKGEGVLLTEGAAVGMKIASGKARIIQEAKNIDQFKAGEVLVTEITDPDWEPIMKIASAIVTDKGGRTSHAAIVSRELGIPAVVGTGNATSKIKNGEEVTIDCSSGKAGRILKGKIPFDMVEHKLGTLPQTKTKVMINVGSPEEAFKNHFFPVKGVGLGRLEFIINSHIRIHPNALIDFGKLRAKKDAQSKKVVEEISKLTKGYEDKIDYYIDELSEGIAKIAAAFYPEPVIIRFSDFKTNEYRTLIGGSLYEPEEQNPMIGWRGASRYYHPKFESAFGLECVALKRVREEMGLRNVIPMIPFCRTPEEGRKVLGIMQKYGLTRGVSGLRVYMMCEIPSNILLIDEFLELFDGYSIGSNDLTQLVLGLDRDSEMLASIGNERDESVKKMIGAAIALCKAKGKYIGICGQAPSDFPDFVKFLVESGIESISVNPDAILKTLEVVAEAEKKR
ncbi:MAG: phosphoenolpyruvate synthase [Patescibacteria group bacterium]